MGIEKKYNELDPGVLEAKIKELERTLNFEDYRKEFEEIERKANIFSERIRRDSIVPQEIMYQRFWKSNY